MRASATRGTLFHLGGACQFSITIADDNSRWDSLSIEIPGVGENRCDAGTNVVATNDRGVADLNPGNIGDRVQGTARQNADLQAEVGSAGTCFMGLVLRDQGG
jgi:hypothetical protein